MVADVEELSDVTQSCLIKVWLRGDTFDGRSSFSTWLYRLVRNEFLSDGSAAVGRAHFQFTSTRRAASLLRNAAFVAAVLCWSCTDAQDAPGGSAGPADWLVGPEPVLQIGAVEGDPAYLFDDVSSVRLLPRGQVVVADRSTGTIRLYDGWGVLERQMGGEGEGPGEFTYLSTLTIVAPDTIVAFDPFAPRITRFLTNGDLESTVRTGAPRDWLDLLIGPYSDGSYAVAWIERDRPPDPSVVTPDVMGIGRLSADGQTVTRTGSSVAMRRLGSPLPFSAHFLAAVLNDELFYTDGLSGRVNVIDARGELLRVIELPHEPVSSGVAWSRLEDALEEEAALDELSRMREVPAADSVPAISDLLVDDEGLLWLKRYEPSTDSHWLGRTRTGGEWVVMEPNGDVVAVVPMPTGVRLMDVRGARVAGVSLDVLGVETVHVYRLVRD